MGWDLIHKVIMRLYQYHLKRVNYGGLLLGWSLPFEMKGVGYVSVLAELIVLYSHADD